MVLLQCQLELSSSRASQRSTLETCSVGGKQLHARHTVDCVLLAFPPFKSLFKLFCSLTAVFYYAHIFSPHFLSQGENLAGGGVYILVWCWSLHIRGRLSYLHDQPTLRRIIIKSSLLMCAVKCSGWCHSCTEDTHLFVSMQSVINVEEAKCSWSCFSPLQFQPSIKKSECEGVPLWEGSAFGSVKQAMECDPGD